MWSRELKELRRACHVRRLQSESCVRITSRSLREPFHVIRLFQGRHSNTYETWSNASTKDSARHLFDDNRVLEYCMFFALFARFGHPLTPSWEMFTSTFQRFSPRALPPSSLRRSPMHDRACCHCGGNFNMAEKGHGYHPFNGT